ncbi:hypothetical protein [Flavobacterium caeni]|uniref:YD repeat-containing protein n=1 Tax=Flavobacterium caeni TaxID=490189 RepID=A0A1G5J6S4_9FLAO|nr:hypothetical protein [Flavobacterium caeni]SCY83640.1 hypothetical protein SAMN02927903_02557 [Flavobacterium caeni]
MKKLLFLLAVVAVSCDSGADLTPYDPNATLTTTLLSKIIETDDSGNEVTTEFNYEGYKIVNFVSSDGGSAVFIYSGNIISQIKYFQGTTLEQTDLFNYNAQGQITSHTMQIHESDYATREDYVHHLDGSISYTVWFGTIDSQPDSDLSGKLFFENGEVVKQETYLNGSLSMSETYTYDANNNPLRNVIGLNQAFLYQLDIGGMARNLRQTSGSTNPVDITYTYTLNGFPETSQSTSALEGGVFTQYFY